MELNLQSQLFNVNVDDECLGNVDAYASLPHAHACVHEAPAHPTQSHECVGDEHRGYDHAYVQVVHAGVMLMVLGQMNPDADSHQKSRKPE